MRIAIVHYHLGQGGVSRVIETTSRLYTEAGWRHVVLASNHPAPVVNKVPVRWIEGLGYRSAPGGLTSIALLAEMRQAADEALGGPPDIWHFHNHSLGKNCLLSDVVARMAEDQDRLLLQIHDMAENGRALNYQLIPDCRKLYPVSARTHYAFLNSRDSRCFAEAGLPAGNAAVIVNPIEPQKPRPVPTSRPSSTILFAPVRGIRRKNLGELVLLSALAPANVRIAISRAPSNPEVLPTHNEWRRFAYQHRLPIEFDVVGNFSPEPGAPCDFESWLDHATHFITTSVAEGFGLPFLEAIAHGKQLIGRSLPHLVEDHSGHGIHHRRLYDRLLIPKDWIDHTILLNHLTADLARNYRNYRNYRRPLPQSTITAAMEMLTEHGDLDFGNLPEALQQQVIERLSDPASRRMPYVEVDGVRLPVEDWMKQVIEDSTPDTDSNQLAAYSPDGFQRAIQTLYSKLSKQPVSAVRYLPAAEILSSRLRPNAFHFLLSAAEPRPPGPRYRAVICDIYGTLLIAPAGGVKPSPTADPLLRQILQEFGHEPPEHPSKALHSAVLRRHAAAAVPFPEIDLRELWREVLSLEPHEDTTPLVKALHSAWHPSTLMPGAGKFVQALARSGLSLGLLSNAQCDTLDCLGDLRSFFAPELTILSYNHGISKPAPELFQLLIHRLAGRGISPAETLYIGNDPVQDIAPAAAAGFKTALFVGHPEALRPGDCTPDHRFHDWGELYASIQNTHPCRAN